RRPDVRHGLFVAPERSQRAWPAQQHDGGCHRRIRPHPEDQSGGRARPLAAVLDHADGRWSTQRRDGGGIERRDRGSAEGSPRDSAACRRDDLSRARYRSRRRTAGRAGPADPARGPRHRAHRGVVRVRLALFLIAVPVFAQPWSFRNHVIPVLTKMGCNQGACHGALAGKNGFKLTLRGYDPEVDYDTLTRSAGGRRVSLAEPAASLILAKPTFAIPHGGGKRFAVDSLEYRVIKEWIEAGAPPPSPNDPQIRDLTVTPASAVLQPGAEQQLTVRAQYSDGHSEDVTRWVKFSSTNEGVATVDDWGKVK